MSAETPTGTTNRSGFRRRRSRSSLLAHGEPLAWLTGGALAIALAMIVGLLAFLIYQGLRSFWPQPILRIVTDDGRVYLGEVAQQQSYRPEPASSDADDPKRARRLQQSGGLLDRSLLRTENFESTGSHFSGWIDDYAIADQNRPEWALSIDTMNRGRFYGVPQAFLEDGAVVATEPAEIWSLFERHRGQARERVRQRHRIEDIEVGRLNATLEQARLSRREVELDYGPDSPQFAEADRRFVAKERSVTEQFAGLRSRIDELDRINARLQMTIRTADGTETSFGLGEIVRAYPANRLDWFGRLAVYGSRWWEFLSDDPRAANTEGGVFPAIFGTVVMTLVMALAVAPFGVLAALFLREYAKAGPVVSATRIAINNLAGVPSIVFGIFGLGFFCYVIGGSIDQLFFRAALPNPTFGAGGVLWASLTLALLTLPVVIVATEEALSAVPNSMREGSYACGASKWQTIVRIVLPKALPGIMTGMILAMARGAGEVAPLMLVGAMKVAPRLPVDAVFPYLHLDRSFMHLGFHIYDLGFQSPDSEAAKSMVFTTTLVLISIIAVLNLAAVWLRTRLRRRYASGQF